MKSYFLVAALFIAGCLGDEPVEPIPSADSLPPDAAAAFFQDGEARRYMHDCQQAVLIFHVPLDRLNAQLPDGFRAIPAEAQYAQLSPLPRPPAAVTGTGWLFVEAHGCAAADGGDPHVDVNVQIAIEADERDSNNPFATVLAYELGRAGHSGPFLSAFEELGVARFGDHVEYQRTDQGPYRISDFSVHDGGRQVLSVSMPAVLENPIPIEDAYGSVWASTPAGFLRFGWTSGEAAGEPVNAYVGGAPPSCEFDSSFMVAEILGSTTCQGASIAGIPSIALMPEVHDMDITWEIHPL